jgi:hypothetical protein
MGLKFGRENSEEKGKSLSLSIVKHNFPLVSPVFVMSEFFWL